MRKAILGALLLVFAAAISVGSSKTESAPAFGEVFPTAAFPGIQVPASNFNLDLAVIEYAPGAFSATDSHQGTRFFVVMEGELSISVGDKTAAYGAGKSVMSPAGAVTKLSNLGTKPARVYYSAIVPAWAASNPASVIASASATPPKTVLSASVPVKETRSVVNVVLMAFWFDPGAALPNHIMNEYNRGLVLEGTASFEYLDGGKESYTAGQVFDMYQDRPGTQANRSTARHAASHTWLATPGKELVTFLPAPTGLGAPSTGDAGLAAESDAALPGWALAGAGLGATAGAVLIVLRGRRRIMTRR